MGEESKRERTLWASSSSQALAGVTVEINSDIQGRGHGLVLTEAAHNDRKTAEPGPSRKGVRCEARAEPE